MGNLGESLDKKRAELGLDRFDDLKLVQAVLENWYMGLAKAKSLNNNVLHITTSSSSVASELRMRQTDLIAHLPKSIKTIRIKITIN
jgi:hypothetical protein